MHEFDVAKFVIVGWPSKICLKPHCWEETFQKIMATFPNLVQSLCAAYPIPNQVNLLRKAITQG